MATKKKSSAKQYLAQARECIQAQNWEEGAKCCKLVLKKDQANYGAWLFMGKCCTGLNMLEQAQKSYRKAAELKPGQAHPWQGMMETVEAPIKEAALLKEGPAPDEKERALLETYAEALQHLETLLQESQEGSKKYLVIKRNLARALFVLGDLEASLGRWEWLLQREGEEEEEEEDSDEEELSFDMHGAKEKAFVWSKIIKCLRSLVEQEKREKSGLREKLWVVVRKERLGAGSLFVDELLNLELAEGKNRDRIIDVCLEVVKAQPTCSLAFSLLLEALQDDPDATSEADKRLRSAAAHLQRQFLHSFPHHSLSQTLLGSWMLKTSASEGAVDLSDHPSTIVVRSVKQTVSQSQFASDDDAQSLLNAALDEAEHAGGRAQLAAHYQARGMHKTTAGAVSKALSYCKQRCAAWEQCSMKLMQERLLVLLAHTYVLSNKPLDAERVFQKVIGQIGPSLPATEGLAELALAKGDLAAAAALFQQVLDEHDPNNANATAKLGKVALDGGDAEKAETLLLKSMEKEEGGHLSHYWLALALWRQGGTKKSAKNMAHRQLLLCAKAEPSFAPAFARLGTFYAEVDQDKAKAKKCYEKALALDAVNDEAGIALTTMYEREGKQPKALAVYRDVTKKNSRAKWAWVRLADYHAQKEQFQDAQGCYQAILRVDSADVCALSGLAVAYKRQGKYVAAMKAYNKALELDETSAGIQCSLADLQLEIGLVAEAIDNYCKAMLIAKDDAEVRSKALLGLAESRLVLAVSQAEDGMYAHAAVTARSCMQTVHEAFACGGAGEFLLWKILGDAFASAWETNEEYLAEVSVPALQASPVTASPAAYLAAGSLAYSKALALQPDIPELHSDFAVSKWRAANLLKRGSDERAALAAEACKHMKRAVELDPSHEEFWVSLAIMSEADPAYQQHILCVVLEAKPKCVEAWVHLAILYIRQNLAEEAHQCICKAQTLDPEQDAPWLGLAILSELECTADGRKRAQQQYVHAFGINPNASFTQLSTGYMAGRKGGQWKDAMLPLVKYVEQKPKCSLGWTLLGIMEERRGILSAAKKSFKRAVQLVLQEEKAAAGKKAGQEPGPDATVVLASTGMEVPVALKRRRTFLNLARVLVRLEEYEAAAKIYDKTFQAASGAEVRQAEYYAIALQKAGRHQAAVDLLSRGVLAGPKGGTLLALVYFDQGSHAKAAAVISSCVAQFPEDRIAWETMASVALAMGNGAVAKQCVAGLEPLAEELLFYRLRISANIADGDIEEANKCFSRLIHQHPDNLEVYLAFGDFLLAHMPTETKLIQFVLANALSLLSFARLPPTCDIEVERLLSLGRLVRYAGRVGKGNLQEALELARRNALHSLHLTPECAGAWYLLAEAECALALLLADRTIGRSAAQAAARARKLAPSGALEERTARHLLLLESLSLTEAGEHEEAERLAKQALEKASAAEEKAAALVAVGKAQRAAGRCQEAEDSFKKACGECRDGTGPVAELVAFLQGQEGRQAEAVELAGEAVANERLAKSGRLRILLHGVVPLLQRGDTAGAQALVEKANKGVGRQHAILQFLSGLSFIAAKQPKRAVRPLERCLALDPGMPFANFALAQAHLALKQPDLAESDALFELDNNPAFDLPCLVLAKLAEQQKLPAKAAEFYSRGAALAPQRPAYAAGLQRTKAK